MSNQQSLQSHRQATDSSSRKHHLSDKTDSGVFNKRSNLDYWHRAIELSFENLNVFPGHQCVKSVDLVGTSQRIIEAYGRIFCQESRSAKVYSVTERVMWTCTDGADYTCSHTEMQTCFSFLALSHLWPQLNITPAEALAPCCICPKVATPLVYPTSFFISLSVSLSFCLSWHFFKKQRTSWYMNYCCFLCVDIIQLFTTH